MELIKPVIHAIFLLTIIALGSALDCETDYVSNGNWCYKLMGAVNNFDIAVQNCEKDGGSLASVHDSSENAFIMTFGRDLLLGLHYSAKASGSYEWNDGTPFNFSNWEQYYPMDHTYFGDCVMLQKTGTWVNTECFASAQYVCKKAPSVIPTSDTCPTPPDNQYHDSGELISPGYPGNYLVGLSCAYLLLTKNGLTVTIEITEIKLGAGDVIEIFAGLAPNNANRLAVLQGNLTGIPLTYTTPYEQNKMLVIFSSKSQTGGYWKFHFYSQGLNRCPDTLYYRGEGQISPVGYPYAYGTNLVCDYQLSVNWGEVIDIEFSEIDIESDTAEIAIYDGTTASGPAADVITRSTGKGHKYQSKKSDVIVRFVSGPSHDPSLTGWSATFKTATCAYPWFRADESGLGYCYLHSDSRYGMPFRDAKEGCEKQGGKLLMIQNAFQNAYVAKFMGWGGHAWLDLVYVNGMWQWSDGSLYQYRNWRSGHPYKSRDYHAAINSNGEWYTVKYENELRASETQICFKP